jgi:hypothetical protein
MKADNKPFTVSITEKGSKDALPSIWYGGMANSWFNVIVNKKYRMYEVINGKYKGKVIDPKDCTKVTILIDKQPN